jgi:hypothetical protein
MLESYSPILHIYYNYSNYICRNQHEPSAIFQRGLLILYCDDNDGGGKIEFEG